MSPVASTLLEKITTRRARAGVIGLGYVGLPLAVEFARAGLRRPSASTSTSRKVARDQPRRVLHPRRADARTSPTLVAARPAVGATTDFAALAESLDTINICVPTPLRKTKDPDMSLHRVGRRGDRRSTCTPGSSSSSSRRPTRARPTRSCCRCSSAAGSRSGEDFFLAFSPERVDPGNPTFQTRNTPKVVGGATPACTELAAALYARGRSRRVVPGQLARASPRW